MNFQAKEKSSPSIKLDSLFSQLISEVALEIKQLVTKELLDNIQQSHIKNIPSTTEKVDVDILTKEEAIKFLQTSSTTFYRYQKTGLFPTLRFGRKTYFRRSDLLKAISNSCREGRRV